METNTIAMDGTTSGDIFYSNGLITGDTGASNALRVYAYHYDDDALRGFRDQEAEERKHRDEYTRRQQEFLQCKNRDLETKLGEALRRIAELEQSPAEEAVLEREHLEGQVLLPILRQLGKRERIKMIAKFIGKAAIKAIIGRLVKQTGIDLGWFISLFT